MHPDMASGAVLIAWIRHVVTGCDGQDAGVLTPEITRAIMTLQTQGEDDGPPQQARVRRPMRKMAGFASVHSNGFMFIEEGPALFGVALQARLFVGERLIH
jgi:hypothetical protein